MIIGAANAGGDSDAIAAMAGAMFGAWYGIESINDRWLRQLEDASRIKQIACELYRMSTTIK